MQDLRALIDKINESESRRLIEGRRFVEEQQIKKKLAPQQWEILKKSLAAHCESIGKSSSVDIRFREDGINEVVITNVTKEGQIHLSYVPEVPCIEYQTPSHEGNFFFRVGQGGTSLQFIENDAPLNITDIPINLLMDVTG
jgi:hypothetical protein